jgi:glycosyltransferase involved in cell wall biosynthesis
MASTPLLDLTPPLANGRPVSKNGKTDGRPVPAAPPAPPDAESLRRCAWEIGAARPGEAFSPTESHVGLAVVAPGQGYAHWRILPEWVDHCARQRGPAWHDCRLILRLYDVSYILFNGLNAHRIDNFPLPGLFGQRFFSLPRPGTWQLAEVGFELRGGEFIPAARSQLVQFPPHAVSPRSDHAALLVDDRRRVEEIGNLWDQERVLLERRKPKLRKPLCIAAFAYESQATGQEGPLARFVSELAAGQSAQGHVVHVFVPAAEPFSSYRQVGGVHYQPLEVGGDGSPLDRALSFARAAEKRLADFPPFDLFHLHEWMTGLAPWIGTRPTVLSLNSLETTRLNGGVPGPLSQEIQKAERALAHAVDCILTPDWLREKVINEFCIDSANVHPFPMDARLPNEWELPLDYGQVKAEIGVGPLDRLMLFVGPLEGGAGPDLLIEALPVLLHRAPNLRLAFAGAGSQHGHLAHRAQQLGVAYAVRLLGHVERRALTKLLRAAEALVLPARHRVAHDDAVVDLARRAGRPVVTTHGGPAYLVRHEETGLVTYDNPGSMVWALDRLLSDPGHAQRMGSNGRRTEGATLSWEEVARHYLELCTVCFPELRETQE